ncbi:hypothetical protein IFM89_031853 [Coptis chinensis]|uniref:Peroxin-7 n=1 Tax=Coptis chinensis TaxID=261450 RepID=A0A835LCB4_9MAGN|nr:hypothetical protein IFM89_031853 [Coptis chinensis]
MGTILGGDEKYLSNGLPINELADAVDDAQVAIFYRHSQDKLFRDDKFLRDTILNLFIAGCDTIASGLIWILWLVVKTPRLEAKILYELELIFSKKNNELQCGVGTSQNFGILGNGKIHVLDLNPSGPIIEISAFDTADGVYDVTWSENNENLLVAAIADGSVKLYDLALPRTQNSIRSLHEHTREVHSVDWNPVRRDSFLSSS